MSGFYFGRVQQTLIRFGAGVTRAELQCALIGSLLTISDYPNGGLVIHRIRNGVDNARPVIPCEGPPEPPRAA